MRQSSRVLFAIAFGLLIRGGFAQRAYTWEQVRTRFEMVNPTLRAGQLNIDESKAEEITAYLRPNPDFTFILDQINPFTTQPRVNGNGNVYNPFEYALPSWSSTYLHERRHKRELRLESARKGTIIAQLQQNDLERNLLFNLRNAFVQTLQAKAVVELSHQNLDYYDKVLGISREQFKAGDISQLDLDRLELQRVQYETDLQNAEVNLRTAKITLLALLDDRTAVDQFDVTGPFDFSDQLKPLDELHLTALQTRPDLRAQAEAVDKARTDHSLAVANGSTDPTFGVDFAKNPPIPVYMGISVNIPLRIFDRNQGEKLRTQIDIEHQERLRQANEAQVFSDVDSAYVTLKSTTTLLQAYKTKYLQQALRVRDTVTYSYQHGGSSLLEFLNAQNDYRTVELNYRNLIGSWLTAASQLNFAVGREVM
ncbi:MAG TPA: TolC family protein [Bryobacteraceae bacterium]|nr:TolC family protein [Bryobacteraceae bacterium]